jgi:hypothetical protein
LGGGLAEFDDGLVLVLLDLEQIDAQLLFLLADELDAEDEPVDLVLVVGLRLQQVVILLF